MLTNEEVDTLARAILTKIVDTINDWDSPLFEQVDEKEDGEIVPVYGATSTEGYGSLRCEYMPLSAIRKLVVECERIYDEFTVTFSHNESGQYVERKISEFNLPDNRSEAIRMMAELSAVHMITSFRMRLCWILEDNVKDCELIAESLLAAAVGTELSKIFKGEPSSDARKGIEEAAERAAEWKRALLRKTINTIPHIIAERRRGAPAKSPSKREYEAEAYAARVEDVYRKLRIKTGKPPTKTSVAEELHTGGVHWNKGSDTRLSAFGNKLRRLKVDYYAIAKKVEDELNNSS